MIQIVHQGDHRYQIYSNGDDIGCIAVSKSQYHNRNIYLNLGLTSDDPIVAAELFPLLRNELMQPLQVMMYASKKIHDFLIAGGFKRRRRCYELEVHSGDLAAPLNDTVQLVMVKKGSTEFEICCDLLYHYYRKTHADISPLTVDEYTFSANLPETVLCQTKNRNIQHFAFVESNEEDYEIAYVGSVNLSAFSCFAESLVEMLFREHDLITAECDDTDPAAMVLKSLFNLPDVVPYDTYILD